MLPPAKEVVITIETPEKPAIFVEEPKFEEPTPIPVLTAEPMYTTTLVGGGGGGGGYIENDFGIGYGKENIIERDMTQRQNLQ